MLEPLRETLIAQALATLRSSHPTLLAWFDQALDAPNWEVHMWAAIGLGWMMPSVRKATREKLLHLLEDPESASVRNAARHTIKTLMPHATD